MRAIDGDALQKEYMHEHNGKRLMLIDVAPTIEPERKKGKWEMLQVPTNPPIYRCSECTIPAFSYIEGTVIKHAKQYLSKFCPNCGAEME